MNYTVNTTSSKTGKRTLFFVSINGKRIGKTNFAKKWEAEKELETLVSVYGKEKLLAWANA